MQYGCSTREADGFALESFDVSVGVNIMAFYVVCTVFPRILIFLTPHPLST